MKKIIFTYILILSLISFLLPTFATAEIIVNEEIMDVNKASFLQMLDIFDAETVTKEEAVSRGEFISLIVKSMKYSLYTGDNFSDVKKSHQYSSYIATARQIGLVSGTSENKFMPDEPISVTAALKIMINALGYEKKAELFGGYPEGYIKVSNELQLIKTAIDMSDTPLERNSITDIIYRFINTPICKNDRISDENLYFDSSDDYTPLTGIFKLTKIAGVVKVAGNYSMTNYDHTARKTIMINGKNFNTEIKSPEIYFGKSVEAYYDEDDVIKALIPTLSNKTVTILADDIVNYSYFKLEAENNNDIISYNLDRGFSFVKNGRLIDHKDSDFKFNSGTLTLIDNNGDNKYDVVFARNAGYMVVASVDYYNLTLYDTTINKHLVLQEKDNFIYKINVSDENGAITEAGFESLSKGQILTVYESDDKEYCEIVASKTSVKGTLESVYDEYIVINGTNYKRNSYFEKNFPDVGAGFSGEFLIAYDKTVTAVKNPGSAMRYGYLVGYMAETKLNEEIKVKILDQENTFVTPVLADKIILNGDTYSNNSPAVTSILTDSGIVRYQVIRYQLNNEGFLKKIDTSTEKTADMKLEDIYNNDLENEDSLVKYANGAEAYHYSGTNALIPVASKVSDSLIFGIPNTLLNATKAELHNVDDFEVITTSQLSPSKAYTVDLYDPDEEMSAGVIVVYLNKTNPESENHISGGAYVVDELLTVLTDEGDIATQLTLYNKGSFVRYILSDEAENRLKQNNAMPESGDIVRITLSYGGKIKSLSIDAKYNESTRTADLSAKAKAQDQVGNPYYKGTVYNASRQTIVIKVSEGPTGKYTLVDSMTPLSLNDSTQYIKYDTKNRRVKPMQNDEILSYLATGTDTTNAVVKTTYQRASMVVIYD